MAFLGIHSTSAAAATAESEHLFVIKDRSVVMGEHTIYEHPLDLTSVSALSPDGTRLALTDVQKNLIILLATSNATTCWVKEGEYKVPKCPTAVAFHEDVCYVSEKFGQVFLYPPTPEFTSHVHLEAEASGDDNEDEANASTEDANATIEEANATIEDADATTDEKKDQKTKAKELPLLGHVSMLTAMLVTPQLIITGDRDEKIRITDRRRPYIIHAFLLNHTSFISDLLLLNDEVLVSADGAGRVCWWNLTDYSLMQVREFGFCVRQLCMVNNNALAVVQDDSSLVHILSDDTCTVVLDFGDKVHCCRHAHVSTLSWLFKIKADFTFEQVLEENNSRTYEPKGRIAKRPVQHY